MGVRTNSVEAKAIVNHYDLTGSGEMNYEVFHVLQVLHHIELSRIGRGRISSAIRARRRFM